MMKTIAIQDLTDGLVKGVHVTLPKDATPEPNAYFEWTGMPQTATLNTNVITGGTIRAWRHQPLFTKVENHIDAEVFFFVSGTAIMLFVDYLDGVPQLDSAQMVRIYPGTQIVIDAGKGHFVPVAQDDVPVLAVVASPAMPAPITELPEPVLGVLA